MKRNDILRRIIILAASGLIVAGIATFLIIGGSYYWHHRSVDNTIRRLEESFSQNSEYQNNNTVPQSSSNGSSADDESGRIPNNRNSNELSTKNNNWQAEKYTHTYNVDTVKLREDSLKYNEALKSVQSSKLISEESYSYAALDLSKYGIYDNVYGYVSAPAIDMELPIYLGVTDGNMEYGAAHFCYTSLPTGGENTNCALAGHTGYVGSWLFDNIRYLNIGDTVNVNTYIGSLQYKVTAIKYKLPNQSEDIYIEKGKDKLTMVTCFYDDDGTYMRCIVICER